MNDKKWRIQSSVGLLVPATFNLSNCPYVQLGGAISQPRKHYSEHLTNSHENSVSEIIKTLKLRRGEDFRSATDQKVHMNLPLVNFQRPYQPPYQKKQAFIRLAAQIWLQFTACRTLNFLQTGLWMDPVQMLYKSVVIT